MLPLARFRIYACDAYFRRAGIKDAKTTVIYVHVFNREAMDIKSPADDLWGRYEGVFCRDRISPFANVAVQRCYEETTQTLFALRKREDTMLRRSSAVILCGVVVWSSATYSQTKSVKWEASYIDLIERHFQNMQETGTDVYGPTTTAMWMSVLDTRTGRPPDELHVPKRVYRKIGAPQGTTLYWDQPLVVAAHELSRLTGKPQYAKSADSYIKSFLNLCPDKTGMFPWGNHRYYDAVTDKIVQFNEGHHELRPITPAWELFWRLDRQKCDRYVREIGPRHIFNKTTGAFSRHDDGKKGHSFIEAGGILVESQAWLYAKTKEPKLLETALKIARYTHSHQGESTGLVMNEPTLERWDSRVCTTEIGVWAQSLLRAAKYTLDDEFAEMARSGISAYLKYGYDNNTRQYYGQIRVHDGKPENPKEKGYWPGMYADIWSTGQWPTHDYPMAVAEACVTLYEETKEKDFRDGIYRWAKVISENTPANGGKGAYAEHYGRCIHFLARAAGVLKDKSLAAQAHELAEEAVDNLYDGAMFQGYPGTHLYESVDGIGYLFLALMQLEIGQELDFHGFGF
jgi:pectate lyase-like protein